MKLDIPPIIPVSDFQRPEENQKTDSEYQTWKAQNFKSLSIEIGCGAGFHPIQWSKRNPEHGLVALERTQNKFQAFQRRLSGHSQTTNIFPRNSDARLWLPNAVGANEIAHYYFLYPNPYPKSSQANKRWHRNPLMHFIMSSLQPQGTLTFASNELWLKQECIQYMTEFWQTELIQNTTIDQPRYPTCLLYTSPSPRDRQKSRMPSSA